MEKRIIECVPNFSEGRDKTVIREITTAIEQSGGVTMLDVDPGEATNRTVVTFVGDPESVVEAAFQGVKRAGELIDMRHHKGAHPRMGATDVLPLIPIAGITLEECAIMARELARRIADELMIPTYCYEASASTPERRNLAVCRKGEYEALPEKVVDEHGGAPDFGGRPFDERIAKAGCTAVGARDFLIAVNFNLNTTSTRRANAIAFDVREKGRPVREGNPITGKIKKDAEGRNIMQPGTLKCTKAIGWYIEEYGIAQVSMNITNISETPLHVAFDEVRHKADARGLRVTGTEIVGLVPKRALIEAGRYFLKKQHRSVGISEEEIVRMAVKSMGLDDLKPFNPQEKVIEYMLEADKKRQLVDLTCKGFAEETASESPAPGGGSISAYMGALGAALATMVANLSAHKAGWDDRWEEFSDVAERGQKVMQELLHLVDEDTEAFNRIMGVFAMPKSTDEEKALRAEALEQATLYATQVPLRTMKTAMKVFPLAEAMAREGNPNSVSDAGVGALAARSAVLGAHLNVKINAAGLKDRTLAAELVDEADELAVEAQKLERETLEIVNQKIG